MLPLLQVAQESLRVGGIGIGLFIVILLGALSVVGCFVSRGAGSEGARMCVLDFYNTVILRVLLCFALPR